ncbi:MAG: hypothetical protein GF320_14375 [Armatimonadia bacterium]|nr:hypothetical protein [Armatimonadia bacterium]
MHRVLPWERPHAIGTESLRRRSMRVLTRELDLGGRRGVDFFAAIRHDPCPWMLESADGRGLSLLGSDPLLRVGSKNGSAWIEEGGERRPLGAPGIEPLRQVLSSIAMEARPPGLPFVGGLVGFLGYDTVHAFERLPRTVADDLELPDYEFLLPSYLVAVQPEEARATVLVCAVDDEPEEAAQARLSELSRRFEAAPIRPDPPLSADRVGPGASISLPWESTYSQPEYETMVLAAKEYIAAGDIIQANLSQRLSVPMAYDAFDLYERLRAINPSPFAFTFDFGDYQLVSCSPERLIERRGRQLQTRPIAGTRRRGRGAEDVALKGELLMSEKERAEHIMLVDLERNDLGRVCEFGTVRVDELMTVESYSHVSHIVSNVVGTLRADRDSFDAIAATFPGGTITGCPKIRCMEIIDELERTQRGPYTGSAGYIGLDGDMDLNIIIRTFAITGGRAYIQVGGGVVADSQPAAEYEETLHKARALLLAAQECPAAAPVDRG